MLECRVLGPVEMVADGVQVEVGGALPRRLVAALAAAGGSAVSDDRLAEAMWDARPPAKAAAAMQAYVSRLRAALGPEYRDRLSRNATGYRLATDELDVRRFAALVESARNQAGQPELARGQLTEALGMWRGEPYQELADDQVAADRSRLIELREVALEELAAARLDEGDPVGAVVQLEQLVREQPLRERRWALLVLGLYRSDRQGDALATLRQVRELLADQLGVDPGAELRNLEKQILDQDPRLRLAEPPRAAPTVPVRRPLTSFLGRARDLAELTDRLAGRRLVSLIGPAGVGKTRLAVEYVASLPPQDGCWFAKLAEVNDPVDAVADAMGLVTAEADPTSLLIAMIGTEPGLLVLDNCEHVVTAAARLAADLVQGCPQLRILTTSREPLAVDGELTLPVKPLPWTTERDAAVELLLDRVRSVRPEWVPDPGDLAAARRVAAALDGLPLAIELAAARARVLGLGEIADRLGDRFALLGRVPHGSLASHQTLEAAIGWSIDLLEPADRALLLKLWAFEGGFTLEAAESVATGSSEVEVLESLSALVTRSVVVADTTTEPTRYLLLESIRAYCRQLDPDPDTTLALQARWVHLLTERCVEAIRNRRAGWFLRKMSRELPNVRAGFAHDLSKDPDAALTTAVGLGVYLYRSVHHGEAIRMLRAALDIAPEGRAIDRGRALNTLTALTYFSGDLQGVDELVDTVVALLPEVSTESPRDYAELCLFLAVGCAVGGRTELTADIAGRVVDLSEQHGLVGLTSSARAVNAVALLKAAHQAGDGAAILEQAAFIEETSRGFMKGWAKLAVAEALLLHPEIASPDEAMAAVRSSLAKFLEHEDYPYALNVLRIGALAMVRVGRPPEDAARLLAAVRAQAAGLGLQTRGLINPAERWVEKELPEVAPLELSWNAMVALLAGD